MVDTGRGFTCQKEMCVLARTSLSIPQRQLQTPHGKACEVLQETEGQPRGLASAGSVLTLSPDLLAPLLAGAAPQAWSVMPTAFPLAALTRAPVRAPGGFAVPQASAWPAACAPHPLPGDTDCGGDHTLRSTALAGTAAPGNRGPTRNPRRQSPIRRTLSGRPPSPGSVSDSIPNRNGSTVRRRLHTQVHLLNAKAARKQLPATGPPRTHHGSRGWLYAPSPAPHTCGPESPGCS